MKPAFTEFPAGRVPWYEVTVYWFPEPAWRFHEEVIDEPDGMPTFKMMLFTAHEPELVTTTS